MASFKEIVTKAVIGKGKRTSTNSIEIVPQEIPNTILGCWIINHNFNGIKSDDFVLVRGEFDINVWYSYDEDTKTTVFTQKYMYEEKMKVSLKEETKLTNDSEIIVRSLKQPTVNDVKLKDKTINLIIEKELGIEIIGDTKVRISVEDEFDDYEVIEDSEEVSSAMIADAIEKDVDEDYLNEDVN